MALTQTRPPVDLLPGDILLYAGGGFFSWAIEVKSWSDVSHCETYVGEYHSVAARDGVGVGTYPMRLDGLKYVLRPTGCIKLADGLTWQATVDGQEYDWLGLFSFFLRSKDTGSGKRMFCSEHCTRFARALGIEPFSPDYDADKVSPGMFKSSTAYRVVFPLAVAPTAPPLTK